MQELIKKLNSFKIDIDLIGGKLDVKAPKGVMTEELLQEIKLHKDELKEFISTYKNATQKDSHYIPRVSEQLDYAMSSSQRRLWVLNQIQKTAVYNMPSVFELRGKLDTVILESAFLSLIKRHESLRTVFKKLEARQIILSPQESKFELRYEDLTNQNISQSKVEDIIHKEITYSFDLTTDSLLRAKVLRTSRDTYLFICVMHHIISDGWSAEVMTNELFMLYEAYLKREGNPLAPLDIQYKDYAEWQQTSLVKDELKKQEQYWIKQFEGEIPVLELPTSRSRPAIKTYVGKSVKTSYNFEKTHNFNSLCKAQDSTLFMGLFSAVKILLYRYTGQNDLVIGSPIAGREHSDLQNQIGFYANTLALRAQFEHNDSFRMVLEKVKKATLEGYKNQSYPYDEIVEKVINHRDVSRNPLFDVMVTMQNENSLYSNNQKLEGIEIKRYPTQEEVVSKFDLEFTFTETKRGLDVLITYNTDIYDSVLAERLTQHLGILIDNIVDQPDTSIDSYCFLPNEEKNQLLNEFNDTKVDCTKSQVITGLFEEQVQLTPDNVAVIFGKTELTYKEINEQSNQLAHYLRETYTVRPDDLIGIKLQRNEELIVTVLGVLKSGAAYVPIDIDYPEERIRYIEKDSDSKVIIDKEELKRFRQAQKKYSKANIKNVNSSSDLAYIIYTSGSTGKPKGVMIEHRNAVAMLYWSQKEFVETSFDIMYAVTSHCFDLSVYEMFYPLSIGKKIRVVENGLSMSDYITQDKNILINTVPSVIHSLLKKETSLANVIAINMAGEPIPITLSNTIAGSGIEIRNLYGPSEDTTYSSCFKIDTSFDTSIPIGKPIHNTRFYILSDSLELQPFGVIGEICISGSGLSRGYLNRPNLTKEKFVKHPFIQGERLYRTGDLGRWLPDGTLEFIGRKDNQVKIRGYRIELGEIENTITSLEEIEEAVVIIKEKLDDTIIVAYLVSSKVLDIQKLRYTLSKTLPGYMLPTYFVVLDSIPLTPNGKVDKKSLPKIKEVDIVKKEYVAPETKLEADLVQMWKEVLNVEKIGITNDFFELGGHSLKATELLFMVHKEYNVSINLQELFVHPTIQNLAISIENAIWLQEVDYDQPLKKIII